MKRQGSTALAVAVVVVLVLAGCLVGLPLLLLTGTAQATCQGGGGNPAVDAEPIGRWEGFQVAHATAIVAAGRQLNVPPRGLVIALATAMRESSLKNYANSKVPESLRIPHDAVGHDHDSVGLFQQRPLPPAGAGSWGTVPELMTPSISARKFYRALLRVPGWEQMRLTDAAQAVQRSGLPEAYQEWQDDAEQLAAKILGLPNIDDVGGGDPVAPCGAGSFEPGEVGPGGWIQPVRDPIVSPFGQRSGRLHAGVDLSSADIRGDPIYAASSGIVIRVRCNSSIGTCDRDGGTGVMGCGWYVDMRHAGGIGTRYCHMGQQPFVKVGQAVQAGQLIGVVGSSGHSSGPHLHFQVHRNVGPGDSLSNGNAVDPVPFMASVGAPLG